MANKISDIIYEEISHELIEVIEEAKRNSQNPQFLESLSHKIINDLPLENDDEKMVAAALKILRINPKASKFFFQNLQQLYDKIIPISTTIVETQRKILIGYINNVMNEYLNKTPYTDFTEPFDLVYIDDLKIERVIRLIQQLVKDLGTNSGEYEKLYKSLTNLIMHSLETTASHQRYYAKSHAEIPDFVQKRLSTLYKSMTLLYYIMPENIDEKPDKEIFNQYYELHPFSKVREGLYAVRKNIRGEGFIKLLNGMAYKQLIQYQDMRPDFLNKRDLNLLTGLFICTSSPEHTAFFQEPILSFLNPDILRGITRNFDNRVTAERNEIEKLRNLKHQLEKAIDYDINKVGSSDNILKALRDIMGNNSALFTDFFIMLQNGLLAGLSTKEHIDQKIQLLEDHQKKLFKDFAYLTSLISPKLKDVLFDKSA